MGDDTASALFADLDRYRHTGASSPRGYALGDIDDPAGDFGFLFVKALGVAVERDVPAHAISQRAQTCGYVDWCHGMSRGCGGRIRPTCVSAIGPYGTAVKAQ
jgi:hypothetical protein